MEERFDLCEGFGGRGLICVKDCVRSEKKSLEYRVSRKVVAGRMSKEEEEGKEEY